MARSLAAALAALPFPASAADLLVGDGSLQCGGAYTIASGDTLSKMARRAYGDPMLYRLLLDANRDILGGNPELLNVGMSVTIPCVDANGEAVASKEGNAAALEAVLKVEGLLTPADLDTLFGPVALFPDEVLTPVLVAATFPLDVVKAGRFVSGAANLSDQERSAKAATQLWDDSVRELAAGFPALVTRLSDNIDWTEQAGEAVVAQTDEVLEAIQRLRTEAQENGYLIDNEAQKVEEVNDKIVISPTDPNVVYVPTYSPEVVYTTPVTGPPVYHYGYYDDNYDWDDALVAGGIILGGAIILDEIFDDDDWDGWDGEDDIDWDRGDITIDRDEVNIDRGDINVGDGNRQRLGNGERVSIGDAERTQVDRGDVTIGDRTRAGGSSANRTSISDPASRDVARQKIETRKASRAAPASLQPSRPSASRAPASGSRDLTRARSSQSAGAISRPSVSQPQAARSSSRSSAFQQPSRSRPPSVSSSRGHASAGRSGGGRGGGRGGGGRGR